MGTQDLTERFIQFYRNYYREEIGGLAQRYPNEQRSLYISYDDLFQFDRDLAEDFQNKPDQIREYAEESLRLYDLPADVSLGRAHVRLEGLPENVAIRSIRVHDDLVGSLISFRGVVRRATDVRPQLSEAAFECQRCGTMTYIPQHSDELACHRNVHSRFIAMQTGGETYRTEYDCRRQCKIQRMESAKWY